MLHDEKAKEEGKTYSSSSGPDYTSAKKAVTEEMKQRRGENNDKYIQEHVVHPHFCDKVGHTKPGCIDCLMHHKSSADRVVARRKNEEMLVRDQIKEYSDGM